METLNKNILIVLLELAQADLKASVQSLASELGMTRRQVADDLDLLAREGLISAETCRLTFVGLMHATGLRKAALQKNAKPCQAA